MTRIAVVSDTHGQLRPSVIPALEHCDRVLHAGDVGNQEILDDLSVIGPVSAVRGNTDRGAFGATLPLTEMIEIDGVGIYMIHILDDLDIDPAAAGVSVVISGHTHRPLIEERAGVLYLNPGSCGPRRFDLPVTVAELRVEGGVPKAQVIEIAGG